MITFLLNVIKYTIIGSLVVFIVALGIIVVACLICYILDKIINYYLERRNKQ